MSTFSDLLNYLILKKKLTLPYLEKESGLSTALISKIKTGKRLPDSEEKIMKLIKALHCSLEKEIELLKEYRIEKMGREKYLCSEEIRKTIESLSLYAPPIVLNKKVEYNVEPNQMISGENNINTMIQYLIERELAKEAGFLKILLPQQNSFWEDYLVQASSNNEIKNLCIEHIIFFKELNNTQFQCENIAIANKCLHLASIYRNQYQAFYSYKSEIATEFFPYCLLSSTYALLISSDCQQALFIKEDATLRTLNAMFDKIKLRSRSLLQMSDNAIDYLLAFEQCLWQSPGKVHQCSTISYVPCILSSIPPEIAMQRMNPALKTLPPVMNFLKKYWTEISIVENITIFSLKGLELFMKTGICYELPEGCCDTFSLQERLIIMERFMKKAEQGKLTPILIKDEQVKISPKLSITIYDSKTPVFLWNIPESPFTSCFFQEDGIRNNLLDFLSYLQENEDDTYSQEESLCILQEHMKQYYK